MDSGRARVDDDQPRRRLRHERERFVYKRKRQARGRRADRPCIVGSLSRPYLRSMTSPALGARPRYLIRRSGGADRGRPVACPGRVLERVFGASPRVSSTSGAPLGHLLMRVVGRRLFRRHATRAVDLGAMRGSGGVGAIVAVRQALAGRDREGLHRVIVPGVRQAPGLVSGYWAHERSVGESSFWSRSNRGKQPPPSLTTSGAMPQIRLLLGSSSKTFASSRYPPVHSTRTCRAWAR
jgi:hypothetical protein